MNVNKIFKQFVVPKYIFQTLATLGVSSSTHSGNDILPFNLSLLNLLNIPSISKASGWDLISAVIELRCSEYKSIIRLTSLLAI